MKSHMPPQHRTTTKTTRAHRRRYRLIALALALALPTALTIWSGAAAAACNFLMTVASIGSNDGQVIGPRGIATDSAGNVYVADQNTRVQKFNSSGVFQFKFATGGSSTGAVVSPFGLAVAASGDIYLTDGFPERTSGIVQKFNSSGTFLTSWGTQGSGSGQFIAGAGGAGVDSAGNVYVADPGNHRVQKFTSGGAFITSWSVSGPTGVAVDTSDNVYVADVSSNSVKVFTSAGVFVRQFGSGGSGDGQLNAPIALNVDASGNVYVADSGNNRIEKFDSAGNFVSACGGPAAGNGNEELSGPQGIAVDSSGNTYVADTNNDRVQKFGPASATPPNADAGADQIVECAGATTPVTLDGTASTAGTGTINSYSWSEGATALGTGATLSISLPSGSHTITLTVTDTGGGSDTDDVVINIVDTTAPTINVNGANPMTVECHTTFTDPGATATDTCAGSLPVNSSGTVDANTPGTYEIHYSASDGSHTATATRTVNVVDTTPPSISCPADIVVQLPPNSSAGSMIVNYPAVTASDSCSSSVSVVSSPPSGSLFPVGTTTVNATANDGAGHTSSCSFHVTVQYNFAGFFQPIANPPVFNVVNAGRAIPVKFSLSGNKGLNIFAPGSPSSGPVACNSSDEAAVLVETLTAGGSSLSYDAGSDQYNYVWKTESSWAGTCRQLVVTLKDGSIHRANFRFK
jgi:sugar lactone lactonase YvrE